MRIDPQVKPLHAFILDIKGEGKSKFIVMSNLIDIYALEMDMLHVEMLFEFPETFLGDDLKGNSNWSNWKTDGVLYGLSCPPKQPLPQTVGDFIDDCRRIWKIDLIWEASLLRRNFDYDGIIDKK